MPRAGKNYAILLTILTMQAVDFNPHYIEKRASFAHRRKAANLTSYGTTDMYYDATVCKADSRQTSR